MIAVNARAMSIAITPPLVRDTKTVAVPRIITAIRSHSDFASRELRYSNTAGGVSLLPAKASCSFTKNKASAELIERFINCP
jgi:hypothetical protein